MAFIEWNETMSVNVKVIDEQHKTLVDTINKLYDAMHTNKSKEVLKSVLTALMNYTVEHFSTEEEYFDKFDYPERETHRHEHDAFVQKVFSFYEKFDNNLIGIDKEILDFLREWLKNHIMGSDKKYSTFFNNHGLY